MPTPRPIITPSVVAKSGMVKMLETNVATSTPAAIPPNAVPIGKPMANTEPNAKIKITMANARPSTSDVGVSKAANTSPPYSICTPATTGSIAFISAKTSSNSSAESSSAMNDTLANAISPLGAICRLPAAVNGLTTPMSLRESSCAK